MLKKMNVKNLHSVIIITIILEVCLHSIKGETFCDRPDVLEHGTIPEIVGTNATIFPHLFEINYICDKGFKLVGGLSWRYCSIGGWSGENPHCEELFCDRPDIFEHGTIPEVAETNATTFPLLFDITYICDEGFRLIGRRRRWCSSTGWHGEIPHCQEMTCSDPPSIKDGIYELSAGTNDSRVIGAKSIYKCNYGYQLTDSSISNITCSLLNNTAVWSGEMPSCTPKWFCGRPDSIEHGTIPEIAGINATTFPFLFDITYICDSGFRLIGLKHRFCSSRGWYGENPHCEDK